MKGINIGDSFSPLDSTQRSCAAKSQLDWEIAWNNPRITKSYIHSLKEYGFEIVKLPVTWKDHVLNKPNEFISKAWLDRVREVVNWCFDENLPVVIDTHHDEEWISSERNRRKAIKLFGDIWKSISDYFSDIDERLTFEAMSEVGFKDVIYNNDFTTSLESTKSCYELLYEFLDTFRNIVRNSSGYNKTRKIIFPGMYSDLKSTMDSKFMEFPEDNNMEISMHIYPYDLTINSGYNYTKENANKLKKDTMKMIDSYLQKMKKDDKYHYSITEFGIIPIRPKEDISWYIRSIYELGKKYNIDMYLWDDGTFMDRYTGECKLINLEKTLFGL